MLPGSEFDPGPTRTDNRLFPNSCRWGLRSGEPRRDLPQRYGKWETLQKWFTRRAKAQILGEAFGPIIKTRKHPYMMLNSPLCRADNSTPALADLKFGKIVEAK